VQRVVGFLPRVAWKPVLATAIIIGGLSGCASKLQMSGIGPGDTVDVVRNTDLSPRYPVNAGGQAILTGAPARPQLYPGSDTQSRPASDRPANDKESFNASAASFQALAVEPAAASPKGSDTDESGIDLNFDNADIQAVAKSILSDTLGLNVIIDPRVQGNVTLVSAAPIPRKNLFAAFEDVLRMSNVAVVKTGTTVKILPLQEAAGLGTTLFNNTDTGFGVTIIPLRYTSAATVGKLADNFVTRPGSLRTDVSRNLLMIQGTESERRNIVNIAASFDIEWLRNQSVGIYPLQSTSPDTMVKELERVFDTSESGKGHSLINFQTIARMNAVMAVTHDRKLLERATQWVRRLDHGITSSGATIRIYRLEHANARKLAKILTEIFVGKGDSSNASAEAPATQLAPGTNAVQSRIDPQVTANTSGTNADNGVPIPAQPNGQNAGGPSNGKADVFGSLSDKIGQAGGDAGQSGNLPRGVFQNVRITADIPNNSIVIFSNQDDYNAIERSIRELDRAPLQVAIEATIAEVTLTDALKYGVQYYLGSTDVGAGLDRGSVSLSSSTATALVSQRVPGLNVLLGAQASPKAVLSALSTVTSVKVLSSPSLVVTDNQPAFLQVGDSVPISTGSATVLTNANTIVNTIQMQDTGVIMKVWPHVHANGMIDLEIEQQVSNVVGGQAASTMTLNPTISQRRVHSTVGVMSGQTILLGGLMSETENKTQDGVPVLRQITGIGDLFGSTDGTKLRTEIIVFVRPRLIENGSDAQSVSEEFRARLSTMHAARTVVTGMDIRSARTVKK